MKKLLLKNAVMLAIIIFCIGSVNCYAATSTGINVNYHSQKEIKDYLKSKKVNIDAETTYSKKASDVKPYQAGTISESSQKSALNTMNAIRYIAGIDAVGLDSSYTKMEQAAALVNSANGTLSHFPSKPAGMDDRLYKLGASGASSGNLSYASWKCGLGYHLVKAWMNDGDDYNIDRVGHRRWILNPPMEKTGFGWVYGSHGTYAAMYAFDNWYEPTDYYGVAWPAQNMPVEFFGSSYPWSISMGKDVDKSAVKVTLIRQSDQKKWAFSEKKADGYFNVENSNYGQKGCIIFRPENLSYQPGDTFEVKITGLDQKVSYTVNFFSVNSSAESDEKQKESKITAKNITKTFSTTTFSINAKTNGKGKMTYKVADEKIAAVSKKGVVTLKNYGETKIRIRVAASGNYKAAEKTITLTVKPVKAKTGSLKSTAKGSFALKWKQDKKATGYIIQYSTDKRFEKNVKSTTVSSNRTTSKKIGKLKAGKKYYVRICSYKKSCGKNIKGAYSDVKTVITKK